MTKLNLELQVEKNTGDISEILRKLSHIESTLKLVYDDRELINELKESVAGLKQRIADNHDHVEKVVNKGTFEIGKQMEEVKDIVENTGSDMTKEIIKEVKKQ